MAVAATRRPLPVPPPSPPYNVQQRYDLDNELRDYYSGSPYSSPQPFPPFVPQGIPNYENTTSALRGGTLLHKGFYDLLALIPSTPSASRFFWPAAQNDPGLVAGPRYETIRANTPPVPKSPASCPPVSPTAQSKNLKARRISKDMVSKPTGFMCVFIYTEFHYHTFVHSRLRHLVHASDADQAEALLRRWGPEGQGKLGGQ